MVDCSQFLDGYSDFRDDLLEVGQQDDFAAHLTACPSCARYDRVVRRGSSLVRELLPVQPSSDFGPRLQHRIFHLEDEHRGAGRSTSGVSALATLGIAGVLGFAAWAPVAQQPRSAAVVEIPAIAARPPQPVSETAAAPRSTAPLTRYDGPELEWVATYGPVSRALFYQAEPLGSFASQPLHAFGRR